MTEDSYVATRVREFAHHIQCDPELAQELYFEQKVSEALDNEQKASFDSTKKISMALFWLDTFLTCNNQFRIFRIFRIFCTQARFKTYILVFFHLVRGVSPAAFKTRYAVVVRWPLIRRSPCSTSKCKSLLSMLSDWPDPMRSM